MADRSPAIGGSFTTDGDDLTNLFRREGRRGATPRVIAEYFMEGLAEGGFIVVAFNDL
jgi:hypothetical protein